MSRYQNFKLFIDKIVKWIIVYVTFEEKNTCLVCIFIPLLFLGNLGGTTNISCWCPHVKSSATKQHFGIYHFQTLVSHVQKFFLLFAIFWHLYFNISIEKQKDLIIALIADLLFALNAIILLSCLSNSSEVRVDGFKGWVRAVEIWNESSSCPLLSQKGGKKLRYLCYFFFQLIIFLSSTLMVVHIKLGDSWSLTLIRNSLSSWIHLIGAFQLVITAKFANELLHSWQMEVKSILSEDTEGLWEKLGNLRNVYKRLVNYTLWSCSCINFFYVFWFVGLTTILVLNFYILVSMKGSYTVFVFVIQTRTYGIIFLLLYTIIQMQDLQDKVSACFFFNLGISLQRVQVVMLF